MPEAAQGSFGQKEVHVTLKASSIAAARREMQRHLTAFEEKLAPSRGVDLPSVPPKLPTGNEIEAAVREWLDDRMNRTTANGDADLAPVELSRHRLIELNAYGEDVREGIGLGASEPSLTTRWIADALIESRGWPIDAASPLYRMLIRAVGRGQWEATQRGAQDIRGEPRRITDDTFAPEQYRLDAERARQRKEASNVTILSLFDGYVKERKPAPATVKAWKRQVEAFVAFLGHSDARRVTVANVISWKERLLTQPNSSGRCLSAKTVKDTYLSALKTIYRWGCDNDKVEFNPAQKVTVLSQRKSNLREKGLNDAEAALILSASVVKSPERLTTERVRARRWVPWICAYTGARVNEITQLRAQDVFEVRGVWVIRITPEAGSVKSYQARTIALHPHLVEQGFPSIAKDLKGPLFYDPKRHRGGSEGNPWPAAGLADTEIGSIRLHQLPVRNLWG